MIEYDPPGNCLNNHYGQQTIGETMADLIGVKSAYYAWLKIEPNATKHEKQWFFQIFAQSWASSYDVEHQCKMVSEDVHALPDFRVDKTLRQMKEFKELFHCKDGEGMVNSIPAQVYGE